LSDDEPHVIQKPQADKARYGILILENSFYA
jgi:hypothetical protein